MKYWLISLLIVVASSNMYSIVLDSTSKINGTVRAKYEYNLDSNISAFVVRNARYQISGSLGEQFKYKAEIDLSDEGKIKMLDAFVNWQPLKYLDFTVGQMKVPFSTDNIRSPHELAFANRSFMSKRVSSVLRDLGAMAHYNFEEFLPLQFYAGLFNGYGVNKPERSENKNFALRAEYNPLKKLGLSACLYGGEEDANDLIMYNFGFDWELGNFVFDGEFAVKQTKDSLKTTNVTSYFAYVQYHWHVENLPFKIITPAVRFDAYDKDIVSKIEKTSRITAGLTFTFTKLRETHIKLDYENYFISNIPDPFLDKFTIEFMARF